MRNLAAAHEEDIVPGRERVSLAASTAGNDRRVGVWGVGVHSQKTHATIQPFSKHTATPSAWLSINNGDSTGVNTQKSPFATRQMLAQLLRLVVKQDKSNMWCFLIGSEQGF